MQPPEPDATDMRNLHATAQPSDLMTGAEAARELDVNKSTIKRYLDQYPELNRSDHPIKTLVSLEELRQHREENVNGVKSGNHAGRLYGEDGADKILTAPRAPVAMEKAKEGGYASARTRLEEVKARNAEREEAMVLSHLVSAEAVGDKIGEAMVKLRDNLMSPDLDLCERLAKTDDPAEVLKVLRDANRLALLKLSESFEDDVQHSGTD